MAHQRLNRRLHKCRQSTTENHLLSKEIADGFLCKSRFDRSGRDTTDSLRERQSDFARSARRIAMDCEEACKSIRTTAQLTQPLARTKWGEQYNINARRCSYSSEVNRRRMREHKHLSMMQMRRKFALEYDSMQMIGRQKEYDICDLSGFRRSPYDHPVTTRDCSGSTL